MAAGHSARRLAGDRLPAAAAAEVFRRTGTVTGLEVLFAGGET